MKFFPKILFRRILKTLIVLVGSGVIIFLLLISFILANFDGTATLPADCAIVFGAAVHGVPDGEEGTTQAVPGPGILRRVYTAVRLHKEGRVGKLFFTGGKGEGMPASEAGVMRDVALGQGIDSADITIEEHARSTSENLKFIRPYIQDCQNVIGISDAYHLSRIELLAYLQGWRLPTYPAEGRTNVYFTVRSVLREALALVYVTALELLT